MADLFDMTGKVAVVTGGSRGLGREMVLAFAEHGADVVIASRKLENCEAVAEEVRALGRRGAAGGLPRGVVGAAPTQLADAAYAEFGHVEVLVNNAGMSPLYPTRRCDHRGSVRQGDGRQPEGPVPPVGATSARG